MIATLLDIFKRKTDYDKKLSVYQNGERNEYPEIVDRLINNSVTAKMACNIMTQYLIGKGFGNLDDLVINNDTKQKLKDFAIDLADDITTYRGYFLHYSFNANFEAVNPKVLPFEKCRVGEKDSKDYNGKILFKKDWKNNKENPVVFNVFNPDPEIVKYQIEKAGGIEKYTGQVLFFNMDRNYYYPLSRFDSVLNDLRSEYLSSVYKNQLLEKGFFGKTLIITPPLIDVNVPENIYNNENRLIPNPEYLRIDSERQETKKTIEKFIGAENAGGAMLLEMTNAGEKLEDNIIIKQIESKLDDKMFEYTENSVQKNILMACNNLPIGLVKSAESSIFGNSGESIKEMKKTFWENTTYDRNLLQTQVNDTLRLIPDYTGDYLLIKSLFEEKANESESDVKKLDAQAGLKGSVGGVQGILAIQASVSQGLTDYESAITILNEIYGIDDSLARMMLGTPKINATL